MGNKTTVWMVVSAISAMLTGISIGVAMSSDIIDKDNKEYNCQHITNNEYYCTNKRGKGDKIIINFEKKKT